MYDVDWEASGTAVVEADDPQEARDLVTEAVSSFDVSQLEQWDVEDTAMTSVKETHDD